jgi:hypothetical protein
MNGLAVRPDYPDVDVKESALRNLEHETHLRPRLHLWKEQLFNNWIVAQYYWYRACTIKFQSVLRSVDPVGSGTFMAFIISRSGIIFTNPTYMTNNRRLLHKYSTGNALESFKSLTATLLSIYNICHLP